MSLGQPDTSSLNIYPAGPALIPANLTEPTSRYKRHAWLAVAALILFVLLYIGLTVWFCQLSWRMLSGAIGGNDHVVQEWMLGFASAFFAVFMLKGLFFVKHGKVSGAIELNPEQEPALFAFLYKLADEAKAPRPHRVYISATVNAAVFYDLSILNFLFPSRKNLEIGLGLMNVLTLSEFKAVLAHEFGHFAQRSMAVGRWVYIAQQVASHIVSHRDWFDRLLAQLARIDIRIAWISWLLSLIVWSIRSLVELSFRLLLLAQRALSREMEMQADLVAVSLTGSDALMHALHKMPVAEDAWARTIAFANREYAKGCQVSDLWTIQSRIIEHLRVALDDAQYGCAPQVDDNDPIAHRIFKVDFARPPQMWSTHPMNHEREHNAKKSYVSAPLDNRSAWEVFHSPGAIRERVSSVLFNRTNADIKLESDDEAKDNLDIEYRRESFHGAYRGVYLGRSVVRYAKTVSELYENFAPLQQDALSQIYPASLRKDIERLRELQRETAMLKAIRDGVMHTTATAAPYRGRELDRQNISVAIVEAEQELLALEGNIQAHDRLCRTAHLAVARQIGLGWDAYLKSLLGLMHFSDHIAANLRDVQAVMNNVYQVVVASGKVNKKKLQRLLASCQELHTCLAQAYACGNQIAPGDAILKRIGVESIASRFGEFKFAAPNDKNISEWLRNVGSWVDLALANFDALYGAALDEMLLLESRLSKAANSPVSAFEAAPPGAVYPASYPVLLPGSERPKQKQLDWWSRFQRADGKLATMAKLAVALSFIIGLVVYGSLRGHATLTIYNGLDNAVTITVDKEKLTLYANSFATVSVPTDTDIDIRAVIGTTEIEHFRQHTSSYFSHYLYNVASAAVFLDWVASYGNARQVAPKHGPTARWSEVDYDYLFEQPPKSVSDNSGGKSLKILSSLSAETPLVQFSELKDPTAMERIGLAHARYDAPGTRNLAVWLNMLQKTPQAMAILTQRLSLYPKDVYALRARQDVTTLQQHAEVCQQDQQAAQQFPNDPDLQYIAIRCSPAGVAQSQAFKAAAEKWPQNAWLEMADGYDELNAYHLENATRAFKIVFQSMPQAKEWVNLDIARLRRLLAPNPDLDDLIPGSFSLHGLYDLEVQEQKEPEAIILAALVRGDLDNAYQRTQLIANNQNLKVLLAASDGAPAAWVEEVLRVAPDSRMPKDILWYLAALATRNRQDPTPYLQRLKLNSDELDDQILHFYQSLQNGGDADAVMAGAPLRTRGMAYTIATIMKGRATPQSWRDGAKALLFGAERPYFQ